MTIIPRSSKGATPKPPPREEPSGSSSSTHIQIKADGAVLGKRKAPPVPTEKLRAASEHKEEEEPDSAPKKKKKKSGKSGRSDRAPKQKSTEPPPPPIELTCSQCKKAYELNTLSQPLNHELVARFPWQCNDCKHCYECKQASKSRAGDKQPRRTASSSVTCATERST